MIIKIADAQFDVCFKMMAKDATDGGITVLIFVAYDCDAICACHILTVCSHLLLFFLCLFVSLFAES
jgi:hypothetical protein